MHGTPTRNRALTMVKFPSKECHDGLHGWKNELRKNKSEHASSQRAQLLGVTPHELGGQKLAEILIFYVGQKISWLIYEPIGVKLLNAHAPKKLNRRKIPYSIH
jgi:hypothetical protein